MVIFDDRLPSVRRRAATLGYGVKHLRCYEMSVKLTLPTEAHDTHDSSFDAIVEQIGELVEAGQMDEAVRLIDEHPEHRQRLQQLLPTIEALASFDESIISPPSSPEVGPGVGAGVLGDFRIICEIGRGGMGVVYEAEQLSIGRRVALKVLPFASMLDRQPLNRFKNEARAAGTLDHPNIVAIYSVGCERGVHYYAMQLIEGRSLAEIIAAMKPGRSPSVEKSDLTSLQPAAADTAKAALPTVHDRGSAAFSTIPPFDSRAYYAAIAKLGIQAAEALDHAHQNGILHRDIKPANLLVDDAGKLWITDFGLARIEQDAGMTMTGDLLGTLRYMSPEQALAKRVVVDHRSDIYSLGVTLYELLTLRTAFSGEDRQELLRQIAFDDPRKPRQLNAQIPIDLETIVLKAIEKNPADRFATAQKFAEDLHRFVDCRPIEARKPGAIAIARKWASRHRAAATVAAIATVLILMLIAALAADRWRQFREASRFVEASLQAARTSLAAGDVQQAAIRLTEAQTHIDAARLGDCDLVDDVTALAQETDRFAKFVPLLDEIRWNRTRAQGANAPEQNALALYGVMEEGDWLAPLRAARVPEKHIARVSDGVYEMLIFLADCCTRWTITPTNAECEQRCRQAATYLDKAISFHSPSRGYYWQLANCATRMNDLGRARKFQQTALATPIHHTAELLYINRDRRWGTASSGLGFPVYPYEENLRDHREMLRRNPDFHEALFFLAAQLMGKGRHEEALVGWYGCLAHRPNDFTALVNRGYTHSNLRQYEEAIADADSAIAMKPEFMDGWILRGKAHNALKRFDLAIEDFSRAVEVNRGEWTTLSEPLNSLAWLRATAPDDTLRDAKRAIELATKACELTDYKDFNPIDTLAAAYAERGDFEAAITWAENAIEVGGHQEHLVHHLKSFRNRKPWREEVKEQESGR